MFSHRKGISVACHSLRSLSSCHLLLYNYKAVDPVSWFDNICNDPISLHLNKLFFETIMQIMGALRGVCRTGSTLSKVM